MSIIANPKKKYKALHLPLCDCRQCKEQDSLGSNDDSWNGSIDNMEKSVEEHD